MEISIDESGSFVFNGAKQNSWCIVTAYVTPETEKRKYQAALRKLKIESGFTAYDEVKLHQLTEIKFIQFIEEISSLQGTLFAVATDSSLNNQDNVIKHREAYIESIITNVQHMRFDAGKDALNHLAIQLQKIPLQLYIQLMVQVTLILDVIERAINYYIQRAPGTLKNFRWRIDQKQISSKTDFEDAFEKFCPALLQAISLKKPGYLFSTFNYSVMNEYFYDKGEIPEYLVNKFPSLKNKTALDIQKIFIKDLKFINSKSSDGIQIADLMATGLRRLLRNEFTDNHRVANAFSQLFVQNYINKPPLSLISFSEEKNIDDTNKKNIQTRIKHCRRMIK